MNKAAMTCCMYFLFLVLSTPGLAEPSSDELRLWDTVKDSEDTRMYQFYLDRFPDGYFSELAEFLIDQAETSGFSTVSAGEGGGPETADTAVPWLGLHKRTVRIDPIATLNGQPFASAAEVLWEQIPTISQTSIVLDTRGENADVVISGRIVGLKQEEPKKKGGAALGKAVGTIGRIFGNRDTRQAIDAAENIGGALSKSDTPDYMANVVLIAENRHSNQQLNASASAQGGDPSQAVRNATAEAFTDLRQQLVTVPSVL